MTTAAATMGGGNNDSNCGFFDGDGSNATGDRKGNNDRQYEQAMAATIAEAVTAVKAAMAGMTKMTRRAAKATAAKALMQQGIDAARH